jgi:hypothetical protein
MDDSQTIQEINNILNNAGNKEKNAKREVIQEERTQNSHSIIDDMDNIQHNLENKLIKCKL